jgi:nicotinamidase-related amidase
MITAIDKNTALVLIDLQKGVVKKGLAHPASTVLENAQLLVSAFRQLSLPIVWVTVNPINAAWTKTRVEVRALPNEYFSQMAIKILMKMVGYTCIVKPLDVRDQDVRILKEGWNAFFNTTLENELSKKQVTGIVLCGIATSIGVESTARSAAELGLNISFAVDAMTDRFPEAHENSVTRIFPRLGETGKTADIIVILNKTGAD